MSQDSSNKNHHIMPLSLYLSIGSILIVMTAVTVYVASIDFGAYNLLIAMIIAAFKASLVALYFMHLKYDSKLYSVTFVGALLFLAIFVVFTMFDTLRRDDLYEIKAGPIESEAIIYRDQPAIAAPDSLIVDSATVDSTAIDSLSQTVEDSANSGQ